MQKLVATALQWATSPAGALVSTIVTAVLLYGLYRWLLPKPIPGIAFNPDSVKSLLGDAPDMVKEVSVTGELRVWCAKQVDKMRSPICQVFIRPFSKPWVLLADYRESRDILLHRREFDKSSFLIDGMACIGSFHAVYTTGDKFKAHRRLIQDLMTSSFLNGHVGPAVYSKGLELMKLFEIKTRLAAGRPFSAKQDFEYASLDVMLEFAFGQNWTQTALGPQVELLSQHTPDRYQAGTPDEPITFQLAPKAPFLESVYEAPEIVERAINALMPRLQTWWWSKQQWFKKVFAEKERVMKEQVAIALQNYRAGHVKTGLEHMLMREAVRAEKDEREADFGNRVFRDELFGDVIAGHHTTSGAMMWLAKYLSDLPEIQTKLRAVLYATFTTAREQQRLFTFEEIRHARLPYMDAVLEEMFRINAVTVTREALCDTTVLGCPIKKGTQVFLVSNGPNFLSSSLPVDESSRSEAARTAKINGTWDETRDLRTFDPERWLVRKNDGDGLLEQDVTFDGASGPQLVFGLGPRACWGRRLAHMEIRVMIAMLVWNFQLDKAPEALSGHAGREGIARVPQQCYLRLQKI